MGREKDELPDAPPSLSNMDPTMFRPNWNAQGRRYRAGLARKNYDETMTSFYEKGVAKVNILAAVDDSRATLRVLVAAPPGIRAAEY
jgi:hypothetical protein